MIFYYFPNAQNTANKTVRDYFFRDVYACLCMCTYLTMFLFTDLVPVYTWGNTTDANIERLSKLQKRLHESY